MFFSLLWQLCNSYQKLCIIVIWCVNQFHFYFSQKKKYSQICYVFQIIYANYVKCNKAQQQQHNHSLQPNSQNIATYLPTSSQTICLPTYASICLPQATYASGPTEKPPQKYNKTCHKSHHTKRHMRDSTAVISISHCWLVCWLFGSIRHFSVCCQKIQEIAFKQIWLFKSILFLFKWHILRNVRAH